MKSSDKRSVNVPASSADTGSHFGPWEGAAESLLSGGMPEVGNPVEYQEGDRAVLVSEVYFPGAPFKEQPTRAFGYFARPKYPAQAPQTDRFPAMLLLHGGGGTADARWARWWARRGYAALAIDLAGLGPDRQRLPDGGPSFSPDSFLLLHGLENTWMYHAVATSIAAVTALALLPHVDTERIGVTGISWGGYFCSTVMSIDARIKLGIPLYGCGFNPRAANGADPTFTDGKLQREAFDPSHFLPRCHKPVLWVTTTNDTSARLDELQESLRATPGPNTLCLTANPGHNDLKAIGLGQRPEIEYFVDSVFRDGEPLVRLGETQREGHTLSVPLLDPGTLSVTWAVLHYTQDLDKPWPERQWKSAPAEYTQNSVRATVPSEPHSTVAFLNVCDDRGVVVASDWCELPA